MTKMEFELTVGDVIECGDVHLLVVDVDECGVHFKIKASDDSEFSCEELSSASTISTRFNGIPR
ncbi:MAG: hypothetical protein CMJ46_11430 [Planctomyces sp.]|nr:hypothetical protein [Planctomyces sp.]